MPHGHFPAGLIFGGFHLVIVAGSMYLLYCVSKSLKRIAASLEKIEQKKLD